MDRIDRNFMQEVLGQSDWSDDNPWVMRQVSLVTVDDNVDPYVMGE
jgi:hypothetical protein